MKKESINSPLLLQKKKLKDHITIKFQEIKDIETSSLISALISKKKKWSSKFLLQDDQFHLENIIKKIIEKMLNKKFSIIITFFLIIEFCFQNTSWW